MERVLELTEADETSGTIRAGVTHHLPAMLASLAMCVGAALRWMQLGTRSLWFDEGYTAWVASLSPTQIIRVIRADTAPPLYYVLLHEWTLIFGRSEAGLRSLSAVFATISLLVFFLIARRLLKNPWAVTGAVTIFSMSYMQIDYAHESRFYAMMAMLGAISLYLVLLTCEKSTPLRIISLILVWTASLYTNNMMAVYLACLGLAWLLLPGDRPVRRRMVDLVIVAAVSGLAFALWIPTLLAQSRAIHGHFWADAPDRYLLARTISVMAGVHEQTIFPTNASGLIFVDVVVIGMLVLTVRTPARNTAIALSIFGLVPIFVIFFYSLKAQPIFIERVFLASGVVLPLIAALPLAVARDPWQRSFVGIELIVLICLCVHSINGQRLGEHDEDWRRAIRFAVATPAKHRLVIFVANEGEMIYDYYVRHSNYSPRPDLIGVPSGFFEVDPPHTMRRVTANTDLTQLRDLIDAGDFDEVVYLGSHNWFADPPLRTLNLLKSKLPLLSQEIITKIGVFRFGTATKRHPA